MLRRAGGNCRVRWILCEFITRYTNSIWKMYTCPCSIAVQKTDEYSSFVTAIVVMFTLSEITRRQSLHDDRNDRNVALIGLQWKHYCSMHVNKVNSTPYVSVYAEERCGDDNSSCCSPPGLPAACNPAGVTLIPHQRPPRHTHFNLLYRILQRDLCSACS